MVAYQATALLTTEGRLMRCHPPSPVSTTEHLDEGVQGQPQSTIPDLSGFGYSLSAVPQQSPVGRYQRNFQYHEWLSTCLALAAQSDKNKGYNTSSARVVGDDDAIVAPAINSLDGCPASLEPDSLAANTDTAGITVEDLYQNVR